MNMRENVSTYSQPGEHVDTSTTGISALIQGAGLSQELDSLRTSQTRQALISNEVLEKQEHFEQRLRKLEDKKSEITHDIARQITKYISQAKACSGIDLREHLLIQARSGAKRFWEQCESQLSYPAQGSLLILYALCNNPLEKLTNEALDILMSISNDLPKITAAKKKYYTQMLYESGLTLSGHTGKAPESK